MAINSNICSHLFTFALMTTGAFSQNVSKLFSELKLVTANLHLYSYISYCDLCFPKVYIADRRVSYVGFYKGVT